MNRRDFITLLGGATAAWPLAARAQQREQKRVSVLAHTSEAEYRDRLALIRDGLAQLGWMEPRNLRIDYRWTDNRPELLEGYARELLRLAPDVIVAEPGPTAEVFQRLTSTIPIVFITATDPVEAGYVQSFAHPGGNMTGFTLFEASLNSKWLELLKDIAPTVTLVAVLDPGCTPPGPARGRRDFAMIEAAAQTFAVTPVHALVKTDAADIARVIEVFAGEPNGAMIVPPSNSFFRLRATIVKLAEQHRLPAIYSDRIYVDAGARGAAPPAGDLQRPHLCRCRRPDVLRNRSARCLPACSGLHRSHSARLQAGRSAGAGPDQISAGAEPQDRKVAWPDDPIPISADC
jgi:putative ABC transport system substrate-binding protein